MTKRKRKKGKKGRTRVNERREEKIQVELVYPDGERLVRDSLALSSCGFNEFEAIILHKNSLYLFSNKSVNKVIFEMKFNKGFLELLGASNQDKFDNEFRKIVEAYGRSEKEPINEIIALKEVDIKDNE